MGARSAVIHQSSSCSIPNHRATDGHKKHSAARRPQSKGNREYTRINANGGRAKPPAEPGYTPESIQAR